MMRDVIIDLLIESPYYGYLANRVRYQEDKSVVTILTSFEQGPIMKYNPDWLNTYNKLQRKGILVHELLHLALLHFLRRDGREAIRWHLACDLAISELMDPDLVEQTKLTTQAMFVETGLVMPSKARAEVYYEFLEDNEEQIDYSYDSKKQTITFEDGKSYQSGKLEEIKEMDIHSRAMVDELSRVQVASQSEDALNGLLSDVTEMVYSAYKVNWHHVLKRFLSGQGRVLKHKTYKRVSRRFEDLLGNKRSTGLKAMVAVDESGSISNQDIEAFYQELVRIHGIQHADIQVVRFDTTCSKPVALQQFLIEKRRTKRGGTDFRPVFELADQMKIPLLVFFTDGDGEAPISSRQKVLWVLTNDGRQPAKYGTSIKFMKGTA